MNIFDEKKIGCLNGFTKGTAKKSGSVVVYYEKSEILTNRIQ